MCYDHKELLIILYGYDLSGLGKARAISDILQSILNKMHWY
jgi:hypothetical protein